MKGEGNRVEVERLPHLSELAAHEGQAVEIASVQDPETGATRSIFPRHLDPVGSVRT